MSSLFLCFSVVFSLALVSLSFRSEVDEDCG